MDNEVLMKLEYKNKHCTHRFRNTFSKIYHEKVKKYRFSSNIIESCLASKERNQVKAFYNRSSKIRY